MTDKKNLLLDVLFLYLLVIVSSLHSIGFQINQNYTDLLHDCHNPQYENAGSANITLAHTNCRSFFLDEDIPTNHEFSW